MDDQIIKVDCNILRTSIIKIKSRFKKKNLNNFLLKHMVASFHSLMSQQCVHNMLFLYIENEQKEIENLQNENNGT